jgi:hypothetical protein
MLAAVALLLTLYADHAGIDSSAAETKAAE